MLSSCRSRCWRTPAASSSPTTAWACSSWPPSTSAPSRPTSADARLAIDAMAALSSLEAASASPSALRRPRQIQLAFVRKTRRLPAAAAALAFGRGQRPDSARHAP